MRFQVTSAKCRTLRTTAEVAAGGGGQRRRRHRSGDAGDPAAAAAPEDATEHRHPGAEGRNNGEPMMVVASSEVDPPLSALRQLQPAPELCHRRCFYLRRKRL